MISSSIVAAASWILLLFCQFEVVVTTRTKSLPKGAFFKQLMKKAAISTTALLMPILQDAKAFGPVEMPVTITSYKQVELCNGKKPVMPGQVKIIYFE